MFYSSRMFSYHVTLGLDKKVLSVTSKDHSLFVDAVGSCFGVPRDSFFIQSWDADFDDWTNLTDATILPDKGKLMVILREERQSHATSQGSSRTPSSSSTVLREMQNSTPANSTETPEIASIDTPTNLRWPDVYSLPFLPRQLKDDLLSASSVVAVASGTLHQLIRVVHEDMIQYTLYPSSQQYHEVCQSIIRAFPKLRDRAVFDSGTRCQPYKTWHAMLINKFKGERGKLKSPEVLAARSKYSAKRKLVSTAIETCETVAKRCSSRSEIVTSDNTGEDDTSVARHIKVMQDEMRRPVKNGSILDDRMVRTMSARRADIAAKPLSDILATYPALQLDSQVHKEVQRMTKSDVGNSLQKFFTARRVEKILELIQRDVKTGLSSKIIADVSNSSDYDLCTQKLGCVLLLLPHVFKEPVTSWFEIEEPVVLTPILGIKLDQLNDNFFNLDVVKIVTYLDKQQVTAPEEYLTAITTVLSMYWVFDVAFPKSLNKTLTFLAGHVCKIMPFKVTPPLLKVINFIYSD